MVYIIILVVLALFFTLILIATVFSSKGISSKKFQDNFSIIFIVVVVLWILVYDKLDSDYAFGDYFRDESDVITDGQILYEAGTPHSPSCEACHDPEKRDPYGYYDIPANIVIPRIDGMNSQELIADMNLYAKKIKLDKTSSDMNDIASFLDYKDIKHIAAYVETLGK